MPHNIVNGFCESGCKVPVKPAAQVEDLQHGGTGVSVKTISELAKALGLMPVYTGPSDIYVDPNATAEQVATGGYFRTFQAALDVLSYKAILSFVTVHLAAGMAETGTWMMRGSFILGETVTITGDASNPAILTGTLSIRRISGKVILTNFEVNFSDDNTGVDILGKNTDACLQKVVVRGSGNGNCIRTDEAVYLNIENCEMYNAAYAAFIQNGTTAIL